MRMSSRDSTFGQHARTHSAIFVAVCGMLALAVAQGIGRFAFTPLLPMMQEDAGLSVAAGGWLASLNYLGYLAGALWTMRLRLQATLAIRTGLAVIVVCTLLMGFVHDYLAWAVLRFCAGVASAWVLVLVSTWSMERLVPAGRPLLFATVVAGVGVGIALAGLACLILMRFAVSSAHAWVVLGVLAALVTAGIWSAFPAQPRTASSRSTATAPAFAWDFERVRMVVCYGIYGFGYIIPGTFLPAMAREIIRDPLVFGWSWPLFGASAIVATLSLAPLQRHFSPRALWIALQWTMAVGVALPVLVPGMASIALSALLVGGPLVGITMVGVQDARLVAGPRAQQLIAAMTTAFAIGQIAGPLCVSFAAGYGGGFAVCLIGASLLLAFSAIALTWPRRQARVPVR
jgi:predicted MFS family arabinose efflux permease